MSSSSSSKRFFKIILCSTLHDHKLRIPDKFVKRYGHELSDLVRFMVPTGGIWCVKVEKIDKTIWLQEGMKKFIEDLSIRLGYFLIFNYKGDSTFGIRIFDLSALEIEYPNSSDSARLEDSCDTARLEDACDTARLEDACDSGRLKDACDTARIVDACDTARIEDACDSARLENACDSARLDDANQLPLSVQDEDDNDDDDGHQDKGEDGDDSDSSLEIVGSSMSPGFTSGKKRTSESWKQKRCYLTRSKKVKIQDDGGIKATGVRGATSSRRNKVDLQSNESKDNKVKADEPVRVSSRVANKMVTSSSKRKNSSVTCKSTGSKISPKPAEVDVNPEIQVANTSLPKNPVHTVTLKPYNISKSILYLPIDKSHISGKTKFIKLQDDDGNEWAVRCIATKGVTCHLAKGWKDFVQAKNLKVGDVCNFETVRINEKVKLKVKISRAV